MKIKNIGIIMVIAAIIALFGLPWYGFETIGFLLWPFLYLVFLITVGAIIMQKMQIIETKVDNINTILEKISD